MRLLDIRIPRHSESYISTTSRVWTSQPQSIFPDSLNIFLYKQRVMLHLGGLQYPLFTTFLTVLCFIIFISKSGLRNGLLASPIRRNYIKEISYNCVATKTTVYCQLDGTYLLIQNSIVLYQLQNVIKPLRLSKCYLPLLRLSSSQENERKTEINK